MSVRGVASTVYREGVGALGVSAVGSLLAGVVLGGLETELQRLPGLLVLVPALLATRGNVYGSLGARLATALQQGLLTPTLRSHDRRLYNALVAALCTGLFTSVFAAIATVVVLWLLNAAVAPAALVAVSFLAGLASGIVLSATVTGVVYVGYRRGLNPDTLVGPVVTTTGDVFGMVFLYLAARVVLAW